MKEAKIPRPFWWLSAAIFPASLVPSPTAFAELADPAPVGWAETYFEIGELVADPVRDIVYIYDFTNHKLLAYDVMRPGLVAEAAIDSGGNRYSALAINPDASEIWVPLPGAMGMQRFSIPDLRSLDTLHFDRPYFALAGGSDGRIYAADDYWLYQIDPVTGEELWRARGETGHMELGVSAFGGDRVYFMNRGLSGGSAPSFDEIHVDGSVPPVAVLGLGGDRDGTSDSEQDFVVDHSLGRIYFASQSESSLGVHDFSTDLSTRWADYDDAGMGVCLLQGGDSVYFSTRTGVRRYRREDGSVLFDYPKPTRSIYIPQTLGITPSGTLMVAGEQHLGNASGIEGSLWHLVCIGNQRFDMVATNPAPGARAGIDQTISEGETATLTGSVFEAPAVELPSEGLLGWWRLDETGGATAADSGPDGRNVIASGASWIPDGRHGGAARFSGSGGIAATAVSDLWDLRSSWLISAWFRTSANGEQMIFSARDTSTEPERNRLSFKLMLRDGLPCGMFWRGDDLEGEAIAQTTYNDGLWHHIALTPNGQGVAIYVDGVKITLGTSFFSPDESLADDVYFARDWSGGRFTGDLDDIRLYDKSFRYGEIPVIAANLAPGGTPAASWEQVSGPGVAAFADPDMASTSCTFSIPGTYSLRLTADDGERTGEDLLQVRVFGQTETVLAEGAECRWKVPASPADLTPGGIHWSSPDADLGAWGTGTTGVGFEAFGIPTDFGPLISTDILTAMRTHAASALVSVPFDLPEAGRFSHLTLRMKYDEAFVAYLNGIEIARAGAPEGPPTWDASSATSRSDGLAFEFADFDVTPYRALLREGRNVLAIHGMASHDWSSRFVVLPELVGEVSGPRAEFERWLASYGITGPDALSGADTDGDGRDQAHEYLFAGDPNASDDLLFSAVAMPGRLELVYARPADHAERGLRYQIQVSDVLGEWREATGAVELSATPNGDGSQTISTWVPIESGFARVYGTIGNP